MAKLLLDRRRLIALTTGIAASGLLAPAALATGDTGQAPADAPVPPESARTARLIWTRLVGDLSGRPIYFYTHGNVWGFKPQSDDLSIADFARRLYGYSGIAARRMERTADGGVMIHQKYWAFYRHPETDAITDAIPNPYTGRTDIAAPMSGPVKAMPLDMGPGADGAMPYAMRIRRLGRTATIETSAFHRFKTPDISWHKLEGNLEDYICAVADLDNPQATHIPCHYMQNLVAEWQTWTGMHGTPGHILFKGNGAPLIDLAQVPADQIAAIERFFPGSLAELRDW
ncbi:DUF1838 family protein [Blastomonas fulva]|uniref:DUF1838 family protein n=1 Tax=Blastomonas fulva TaxID=1550728 RepID=UPI003F6FB5EC